ncbi:uncharacterized protein BT62DRAFT_920837 [Guyanagaster necrorhizus]|uniref:Uncharacterized protein n=1 Tax=Guyanagaster necrorhizus TaxID=856835 RepID=A0A9P7VR15_9AGAR|nr:uncharacterized protein BT62DRAFT_920837 [Guyanagaster necrorhizus MCA 3950]KAG7445088.1 hypothetical protein BT62DRAFT_920837 [Guyanagaster necrorhizus MCA 3950]
MINNNQLIQAAGFLFAIAIAMALSVLAFVKDILALLSFRASSTVAPEYPRIVVTVKVDVVTTQNSTIEPLSSVSSDSTFVQVSSECYSGARGGKRSCLKEIIPTAQTRKAINDALRSTHGPWTYRSPSHIRTIIVSFPLPISGRRLAQDVPPSQRVQMVSDITLKPDYLSAAVLPVCLFFIKMTSSAPSPQFMLPRPIL